MKNINKLNQSRLQAISHGLKNGLVHFYPDELFNALRPYCLGGMPASIMLFNNEQSNGFCYDRAMLMQLAFDNCQVVHASIDSLRTINNGDEHLSTHAFVETPEFGGDRTWVVDTSVGLVFDKDYYYEIEKPNIKAVFSKEQCMQNPEVKSILASDFEKDKYILPLVLPIVESAIKASDHIGTVFYRDKILEELDAFKNAINYNAIEEEIESDMVLFRTDPSKLDEKFGIVRDKYGREVSRNGVPNPYYVTPEECEKQNSYYNSIKDDEDKLDEYFAELYVKVAEESTVEDAERDRRAEIRLKEIKENPEANFYETGSAIFVGVTTNNISEVVEQ